jgi:hypothetical protein
MPDEGAELIKAGTEAIVEGAMKPVSDLIQAIFGPAAEEVGLALKESVQRIRHRRRLRLLGRTQEFLRRARIEPQQVSLKLLGSIIENGSNEEDDDLQDRWASLLANAAHNTTENEVLPSYTIILKELTSRDVNFFDALFNAAMDECRGMEGVGSTIEWVRFRSDELLRIYIHAVGLRHDTKLGDMQARLKADLRDLNLSMNTFERNQIMRMHYGLLKSNVGETHDVAMDQTRCFTKFGECFVRACHAPKSVA